VIVVVWGGWHVSAYLDMSLPTQLAPGNLDSLAEHGELRYVFYAPEDVRRTIEASPLFERLSRLATVEFVRITTPGPEEPVLAFMSRCHLDATTKARAEDAAFIPLQPDSGLSAGSMRAALDALADGKRAVLAIGPKVSEAGLGELSRMSAARGDLALSGRDISQLIVNHPYQATIDRTWSGRSIARFPGHLVWEVPGEGLLVHSYCPQPLLAWMYSDSPLPTLENLFPNTAIDGQWIPRAFPRLDDIHVVRDSDQVALFSIDKGDKESDALMPRNVMNVAVWARDFCTPHHLAFARAPVAFRTGSPSNAWLRTERRSSRTMRSIELLVRLGCLGADFWHVDKSVPRAKLAKIKRRMLSRINPG
jgi:hypothetical protein